MNKKAVITLNYEEPGGSAPAQAKPSTAPNFADLWGTLRLVSAVPTWTPRGRLEDSLALYISGATKRLYVYDYSNGAWLYTALT